MDVGSVAELQAQLSRKFDALDVEEDVALAEAAEAYARQYDGSFEFMVDMRTKVRTKGTLTPAQAKGVLNTMAAEGRKSAVSPVVSAEPVALRMVPEGIYAVEDEAGTLVTLRVQAPGFGSFPAGTMMVSFLNARVADEGKKWVGFAFVSEATGIKVWRKQAMAVVQAQAVQQLLTSPDPLAYGFAYSLLSGNCFVCGKKLDDPVSVKSGIGPVCSKRLGLTRETLTMEERALASRLKAVERAVA